MSRGRPFRPTTVAVSPQSPPQDEQPLRPHDSLQLEFFDEQDNNPLPDSYSQVLGPLNSPGMSKGSYTFDPYSPTTLSHSARNPESFNDVRMDGR